MRGPRACGWSSHDNESQTAGTHKVRMGFPTKCVVKLEGFRGRGDRKAKEMGTSARHQAGTCQGGRQFGGRYVDVQGVNFRRRWRAERSTQQTICSNTSHTIKRCTGKVVRRPKAIWRISAGSARRPGPVIVRCVAFCSHEPQSRPWLVGRRQLQPSPWLKLQNIHVE